MTYEEIMALEAQTRSGMTPEEIQKRQALIRQVAQHSPELAADMAKGPYRVNTQGGAAPSPAQGSGISDRTRGNAYPPSQPTAAPSGNSSSLMKSPTIPSNPRPQVNGTAVQGPLTQSGNYGAPPQPSGPRYDFPQNATGQPVNVTINLTNPQQTQIPGWNMNSKPEDYGMSYPSLPEIGQSVASSWQDFTQPNRGYRPPPPLTGADFGQPLNYGLGVRTPQQMLPQLKASDFGPAQPMVDWGVRRPLSPVQMVTPLNSSIGGTLSR